MTISNATIPSLDAVLRGDRPNRRALLQAFTFNGSPQGVDFWMRENESHRLSKTAVNILRKARRDLKRMIREANLEPESETRRIYEPDGFRYCYRTRDLSLPQPVSSGRRPPRQRRRRNRIGSRSER